MKGNVVGACSNWNKIIKAKLMNVLYKCIIITISIIIIVLLNRSVHDMRKLVALLLIGLLSLVLAACDEVALTGVNQMNVKQIPERMALSQETDDGAVYIDVRETYEFDHAHIEGFTNYPLSTLEETYKELPKDKEIIIICRSGNRSMQAAFKLQEKGYENLTNVQGAMMDWRGEVVSNN